MGADHNGYVQIPSSGYCLRPLYSSRLVKDFCRPLGAHGSTDGLWGILRHHLIGFRSDGSGHISFHQACVSVGQQLYLD